ncbi:MAG: UbiA prenyltransferase family protein [Chitinophagaceae bacterium]|nr:UbiA prenyltransferase family protein [Chitinophagaceae bacterium]
MPVFWFALSFSGDINPLKALLVFIIMHLLVYPSSNGYNSYMDRDTGSIGGIEHPMAPEKELFYVTIGMDILALILGLAVSLPFAGMLSCYIICSRLYSYRGIRLKQYPIAGYFTVVANQGGLVFLMVWNAVTAAQQPVPWEGVFAACFLIGGFYPITQVYQHRADAKDGVCTLSMLLGVRGTFIFCGIMYLIAFGILFVHFSRLGQLQFFGILQIFFLPVLVYFFRWLVQVWKDPEAADFRRTMRMNWLASACTNLAFITLMILLHRG